MSERIEFRAQVNKPRRELSLPQLVFHHADNWMNILGLEAFSAWLMIYTWCDRLQYPNDHVSHHKDIKEVAAAFKCGVNKAQEIIKSLYEHGLLDIVQVKNKFGGYRNIYYWHEIPVYADSMYSDLKKVRSWEDRNWHGQNLAELRKIKNEKTSIIKSRIENRYGSDNPQENSGFRNEPYSKSIRQPYSKSIRINDLNNNVVVVDQPDRMEITSNNEDASSTVDKDRAAFDLPPICTHEKCSQELQKDQDEKPPTWELIRLKVRAISGADISISFAKEITKRYHAVKINSALLELRRQLEEGIEIRRVGAWLRYALQNDIQPDQPARAKTIPKGKEASNNRTPRARPKSIPEGNYPRSETREQKKRELIRSLYV